MQKNGKEVTCPICSKSFYRSQWQLARQPNPACSRSCAGRQYVGPKNPFWGRTHSDETKAKVSASRTGKSIGNKHALGYRHSDEARKRIGEASRKLWDEQRDKMVDSMPRGESHRFHKPPELRRYRKNFTPYQRREWTAKLCAYCGATEFLELDHIIPIFDGGLTDRSNAQTLCRGCNLWKVKHVDLPRYFARLGAQRG